MNKIILLGIENSKRTEFFLKAARELNVNVEFMDINNINKNKLLGNFVKIDPTLYKSENVNDLSALVKSYSNDIISLENIDSVKFLNTPKSILTLLDKTKCKEILKSNDISTTKALEYKIQNIDMLKYYMQQNNITDVFIKPNVGSGAAGVIAYRYSPKLAKEIIYTSAVFKHGNIVNTKRVTKSIDENNIKDIINMTLKNEVIIEKWIPKASFKNYNYDLRVVVQFSKVDYILARLSKNPITNLHLNNNALGIEHINLSLEKIEEIKELCISAVKCFKGLNIAGVDVLLSKHDLKPYIIELNGQGDIIYKDIYDENKIYKNQISEIFSLMKWGLL